MLPPNKTKIVATIGPASSSPAVLEQMIRAGMNVARLNFSHGEFAAHRQNIENIRAAAKSVGRSVAIMADLSGPKMRIGNLSVEKIELKIGDRFTLTTEDIVGDQQRVSVSFARLPKVVKRGDILWLNDGYIQLEVQEVRENDVACVVKVGGELRLYVSGLAPVPLASDVEFAVAGDFNNDGFADLCVVGPKGASLLVNTKGRFTPKALPDAGGRYSAAVWLGSKRRPVGAASFFAVSASRPGSAASAVATFSASNSG